MNKTKSIGDLNADEAATIANEIWTQADMESSCLRLLYHSLVMDAKNDRAAKLLVGMAESLTNDRVTVALADYVLGYVKDDACKKIISETRNFALYRIGLLKHKDGLEPPPAEAWSDVESNFVLDKSGYDKLRQELLLSKSDGSLFNDVHTLIGVRSGLLKAENAQGTESLESLSGCKTEKTPAYEEFLRSETL